MDQQQIPLRNSLFRLQFEPAQDCYVLLFPEGMVKLNPSAGEIMQRIDGISSIDEIVTALEQKFPQAGSLKGDVAEFLATALVKKWIYYEQ